MADIRFLTAASSNDWMGSADWPLGHNDMVLHMWSSAYAGMDVSLPVKLVLEDPKKVPQFKAHPEDEFVASQPSSVFEMLQATNGAPEVDSDFEDENEKRTRKEAAAAKTGGEGGKDGEEGSDHEHEHDHDHGHDHGDDENGDEDEDVHLPGEFTGGDE